MTIALDAHGLELLADFAAYAKTFWKVPSKAGKGVKFALNPAQKIVLAEIDKLRAKGVPVRIKILKSRQQGISTFFRAFLQHLCQTSLGINAISIADKIDLPVQWLRCAKGWHEQTPKPFRPALDNSNRMEMYFGEIGCRYSIGSEGGKTPGQGATLQAVHASEIASWRNYTVVMGDLLPSVPKLPSTIVAMESTGDMEGDDWHEQVMLSLHGGDEFSLVFLPWWLTEEYQMKHAENLFCATPEEGELQKVAAKWAEEHPEHAALAKWPGRLTNDQLVWRRWTIRNEFGGDVERFRSRYPSTIEEAFMNVGSLALPQAVVKRHKQTARAPSERVRFDRRDGCVQALPADEGDFMAWALYEPHAIQCEYTIGGDSASGKVSDPRDERSKRDNAALYVMNRRNLGTVAILRGSYEPDLLGEQMLLAAEYYNQAWIAPEVNNTGYALVAAVRKYPYVIPREGKPDTNVSTRQLQKIGWETNGASREILISNWEKHCRADPQTGYDGKVQCFSDFLADEEKTFILDKNGKKQHRPGCHDDVLFAAMLALQAHLSCPHVPHGQPPLRVISDDVVRAFGAVRYDSSDRVGGTDSWEPGDNDDED